RPDGLPPHPPIEEVSEEGGRMPRVPVLVREKVPKDRIPGESGNQGADDPRAIGRGGDGDFGRRHSIGPYRPGRAPPTENAEPAPRPEVRTSGATDPSASRHRHPRPSAADNKWPQVSRRPGPDRGGRKCTALALGAVCTWWARLRQSGCSGLRSRSTKSRL